MSSLQTKRAQQDGVTPSQLANNYCEFLAQDQLADLDCYNR